MITQGSPEWLAARCGRATASNFADILAKGEGKSRATYLRRLVAERLTGKPMETFSNWHTDRGTETEPFARIAYMAKTGRVVDEAGFIPHATLMAGASPDGLVSSDGGIEAKCVIPTVQIETIKRGGYPSAHKAQIQGNLWVTGRQWWDFISHSEDMPENLRTYVFRVERDEDYIRTLEAEVSKFLDEVAAEVAALSQIAA